VYTVGTTKYIARTRDRGETWAAFPIHVPLTKVYFLTPLLGWAVGVNSAGAENSRSYTLSVFVTRDGGEHWSLLPATGFPGKPPMLVTGVVFVDETYGWLVGEKEFGLSFAYETADGGRTFAEVAALSDRPQLTRGISSDGTGRIWAYGNDSLVVSTDRGKSWRRELSAGALAGGYSHLAFMSAQLLPTGVGLVGAQGAGGVILRTGNAGESWDVVLKTKDAAYFDSISFWDDLHGCMAGSSNFLFCTNDGGHSWSGLDVLPHYKGSCPSEANLFTNLIITQSGKGWLRDNGGELYQTNDGGKTWHEFDPARDLHKN
jgi:photosystem II stability/assembly factor-like uncharacterized protein